MAELVGTEVDDFVTGSIEPGDQLFFEFKFTVISCKSYAHRALVFFPGKAREKLRHQMGISRFVGTLGSSPRMYLGVHQMKA